LRDLQELHTEIHSSKYDPSTVTTQGDVMYGTMQIQEINKND